MVGRVMLLVMLLMIGASESVSQSQPVRHETSDENTVESGVGIGSGSNAGVRVGVGAGAWVGARRRFCPGLEVTTVEQFGQLSGCSVIEGGLSIRDLTFPSSRNFTNRLLRQVVEISDYLLLHNVRGLVSLSQLLPKLTVIRGYRLFADRYALAIIGTELVDLGLRDLVLVERGAVTAFDNFQLCLYTIDWPRLLNRAELRVTNETYRTTEADVYLHNNAPRSFCITRSECPMRCPRRNDWRKLPNDQNRSLYVLDDRSHGHSDSFACWNANTCQKDCPKECSLACGTVEQPVFDSITITSTGPSTSTSTSTSVNASTSASASGNLMQTKANKQNAKETRVINVSCCHSECLGGCSGDKAEDCTTCKSVWHAGRCQSQCPPGKLRFLHRCVTRSECLNMSTPTSSDHYIYEQQCVQQCPAGTSLVGQECKSCWLAHGGNSGGTGNDESECFKTCPGMLVSSLDDVSAFTGCAVVIGNLTIRISYSSLSIMHPDAISVQKVLKEAFRSLRIVKGHLRVLRSHVLTSLDFLSELRLIESSAIAQSAADYAFSVVDNENLESIWALDNRSESDRLRITGGNALFHMNNNLCADKIVAFQKWASLTEIASLSTNGAARTCRDENAEDVLRLFADRVSATFVYLNWRREFPPDVLRSEKAENHRFMGYTVYYRQYAYNNLTAADYAHTSLGCGSPGSMKVWNKQLVGSSTQLKVENLQPYTPYAFYVHRTAISREWERISEFVYTKTLHHTPTRPRILANPEQVLNDAGSLDLHLRWLEPVTPNGEIRFYLIYVEENTAAYFTPMSDSNSNRLRQCPQKQVEEETTESYITAPEQVIGGDPQNSSGMATYNLSRVNDSTDSNKTDKCWAFANYNCLVTKDIAAELYGDFESSLLSPVRRTPEPVEEIDFSQQISARFDVFGDKLMEDLLALHNEQSNNQRSEDVPPTQAYPENITDNENNQESLTNQLINTLMNLIPSKMEYPDEEDYESIEDYDNEPVTSYEDSLLTALDNPAVFREKLENGSLIIHRDLNNLRHILKLQIFTKYTIKIYACQNNSKLLMDGSDRSNNSDGIYKFASAATNTAQTLSKDCSKASSLTDGFTTRGLPERDSVNKSTIAFTELNGNSAVQISWQGPRSPNGLIKYYEIEKQTGFSNRLVSCHPAQANTEDELEVYVARVECGSNRFRIRAVSMWGSGYWSDSHVYNVTCVATQVSNALPYALSISLPLIAILTTCIVVAHKIWKERKRKRTAITSVNPEYVDNFYTPDEWEVSRDCVCTIRKLGAGTFGEVYEGVLYGSLRERNREKNGVKVAVKSMRGATLKECFAFLEEASIMKQFTDCSHIVKLLGIVSQGQPVIVIMELMLNGDLKTFLRRHRPDSADPIGRPPPSLAYLYGVAAQVADGMAYLASKKFVHRDLAARNCLVSGDFVVKIGDFGLARDIYVSDYYRKEHKGPMPIRWMAPESLADGLFDARTDVWAYGVVLWEMATLAEQPYQGMANEDVIDFVRRGKVLEQPDGCDQEFYSIMRSCWSRRPADRPTFLDILRQLEPHFSYAFTTVSWYNTSYLKQQSVNNYATLLVQSNTNNLSNGSSIHA